MQTERDTIKKPSTTIPTETLTESMKQLGLTEKGMLSLSLYIHHAVTATSGKK
jgi:hypothetical protein